MTTFLRILIGVIATVFISVAPVALVLSSRGFRDAHSGSLTVDIALFVVFATLSSIAPLLAGTYASYWSWRDADSRRRLRRLLIVLLSIQTVGLVGVGISGAVLGVPVWVLVVYIAVALLLTPALIALGRAALRRESLGTSSDDWVDTTRADLRKGYRNAAVGFTIGLALAVVLVVGLGLLLRGRSSRLDFLAPQLVLLAVCFAFFGGSIGMMLTTFRVSRKIRQTIGGEYGSVRRIARAVIRHKSEDLTPIEQRNAVRYALIVGRWLPFQSVQFALLYVGLVLEQVSTLFDHQGIGVVQIGVMIWFIVIGVVVIPLQLMRGRRARNYAAEHALIIEGL